MGHRCKATVQVVGAGCPGGDASVELVEVRLVGEQRQDPFDRVGGGLLITGGTGHQSNERRLVTGDERRHAEDRVVDDGRLVLR